MPLGGFGRKDEEDQQLALFFMILVVISSFPIVSTLQIARVMAQTPSEGANVLVDDIIQALKSNDTKRAQIHLNILNQQLPTFVNSTSLESVKVLLAMYYKWP